VSASEHEYDYKRLVVVAGIINLKDREKTQRSALRSLRCYPFPCKGSNVRRL